MIANFKKAFKEFINSEQDTIDFMRLFRAVKESELDEKRIKYIINDVLDDERRIS